MRTSMPSYAFDVKPSETVAQICKRLRALPAEVDDISVDVDALLAGRTSIEAVQIQMVLCERHLARTLNGSPDVIITESSVDDIWQSDYLMSLTVKGPKECGANARITDHVNLLYRKTGIRSEGSCFALTDLAVKAAVANQLHRFTDRVHALTCILPYQLMVFLQDLKQLIKKLSALATELRHWGSNKKQYLIVLARLQQFREFHTDILGFLDSVALTHSPDHFYGVITGRDSQEKVDVLDQCNFPAAELVRSTDIKHVDRELAFASTIDMYRPHDMVEHLRCLASALVVDGSERFSINLRLRGHRIALHYNALKPCWLLQDSNGMPGQVFFDTSHGRELLVARMFRQVGVLDWNDFVCFKSHLYCSAKQFDSMKSRMWLYHSFYRESKQTSGDLAVMRASAGAKGETLLGYGCIYSDLEACEKALGAGVDVNAAINDKGDTPLFIACAMGDEAVVFRLLKEDVLIHKSNIKECKQTPLTVARRLGYNHIARLLMSAIHAKSSVTQAGLYAHLGARSSGEEATPIMAAEATLASQNLSFLP
ncbi:MAG: ankyrin repeat domain-containing protein [Coxiellaceae bacterium]|nr:ankyrin repeat domain-containing protein [Coxiellaceae bacterium]